MKVLAFTHIYPRSDMPQRGPYHLQLLRALSSRCDIRIVGAEPWWSLLRTRSALNIDDASSGVPASFRAYWSVPGLHFAHALGVYWSVRKYIQALRKTFPFDLIFSAWTYPDATAAALLARELNCPLVIKASGSDINQLSQRIELRPQIRAGLRRAQRIIVVSRALAHRVSGLGAGTRSVVVVHNGVDGSLFPLRDLHDCRQRLGLQPDKAIVLFVGRLSEEKGVDVLLSAFTLALRSTQRQMELVIVGEGPLRQALMDRSTSLQMSKHVRFVGEVPHQEITWWIGAADVLCLPSRAEGCPNVILEALASGRPVVATEVGGVPEIVRATSGIVVPPADAVAMAGALTRAVTANWDPSLLRSTVESLSWNAAADKYYRIFEEAVKEWNGQLDLAPAAPVLKRQ